MNQISFNETCSVEGRQKHSLPNSELLNLKYRIREEVTLIYNSYKNIFLT